MVIAFQSVVALCAFAGLAGLVQFARHATPPTALTAGARDDDGVRLGLVLTANGQACGPN